ncbi:MAG: TonB C-terminal domain-containing protein [Deltaproteobacteria bacterium]|jgi:outer membrane biosynthesis protein TonB|nr:TonB C-terminal domain-containing protein [Deltaproteobacteria bacterium]MBW2476926.1 TonB C-terminal domain-containing protein [Deltaproteobacteria bacterium]MBW2504776.1 TonB C-terminal domain-containing protein [Deltaproteobacteria bacterium]MBW2520698.1 TonB C-terminal domain-containing protein [Deltaproteobacteria bacterium]
MSATRLSFNHSNHDHPKLGRFLVASLIAHTVLVILLAGGLFDSARRVKPPVYYVDLVHKPVLNPQAGRPEARAKPAPKAPAAKKAVAPQPKAKPKPTADKLPTAKTKPTPAPKPEAVKSAEQRRLAAIEELRQKQARQSDIDDIKQRLAKLQSAGASVPQDVPIGMPDGSGTEAGVSVVSHVQAFIQSNWALSPYLLDQSRMGTIQAKVFLVYSDSGELIRYRILEPSGDSQFDDSIKRAIIKSKQLDHKLPKTMELTVLFNLKEMAAVRR